MAQNGKNDQVESKMEVEDENEEELLQISPSMDDVQSVSSDILEEEDTDSDEDGIDVTIKSIRNLTAEQLSVIRELQQQQEKKEQQQLKQQNKREQDFALARSHYQMLSGAEKKKYSKLIKLGMDREEAFLLVKQHLDGSTPKRVRDINDTSGHGERMRKKIKGANINDRMQNVQQDRPPGEVPAKPKPQKAYSDMAKLTKVGVTPKDYPQLRLTTEQMEEIQTAFLRKIVEQRNDAFKPKFTNCWLKEGYLILCCLNQDTADWVRRALPTLKLWEEPNLIAVDPEKIPRPEVLLGFFPRSVDDDDDTIRAYIESQNDGIDTKGWHIVDRTTMFDRHIQWTFTVDGQTMDKFKQNNFLINYKFGQTMIRKKGQKKPTNDEKGDGESNPKASSAQIPVADGSSGVTTMGPQLNQGESNIPGPSGTRGSEKQKAQYGTKTSRSSCLPADHKSNGAVTLGLPRNQKKQISPELNRKANSKGNEKSSTSSKTSKYSSGAIKDQEQPKGHSKVE